MVWHRKRSAHPLKESNLHPLRHRPLVQVHRANSEYNCEHAECRNISKDREIVRPGEGIPHEIREIRQWGTDREYQPPGRHLLKGDKDARDEDEREPDE